MYDDRHLLKNRLADLVTIQVTKNFRKFIIMTYIEVLTIYSPPIISAIGHMVSKAFYRVER